jgi:CRISPR/Cas system-associated protein Cas10 (large subunit of type III CRISPR-Cas system)
MKLLVEVPDEKAKSFLEMLKKLTYVKTEKLNRKDEEFYEGLKEAVVEVNLAKQGKIKLKSAKELLDEL